MADEAEMKMYVVFRGGPRNSYVARLYGFTTNKQTKEYGTTDNRELSSLKAQSRASEKEDSITHSGRAGLSLS